MTLTPTSRRRLAAAILGGLLATTGVACGESNDKSGGSGATTDAASTATTDGVAYATEQVNKAKKIPTFTLDAPAFDAGKARGKLIYNIPSSSANPFNLAIDREMAKIAKEYGVEFFEYQNQGSPTEYAQGISQAISRKADLISLMTSNPGVVGPALKRAKDASIPVVSSHILSSVDEVPPRVKPSIAAVVTAPFDAAARLMADWVVADSDGKANVLLMISLEQLPSKGMVASIEDEFEKYCDGCKTSVVNVPATEWAQKLGIEARGAIAKDPKITHVMPLYDSMLLFVAPALRAIGKAGEIKMVSYNGTPGPLKTVQDSNGGAVVAGENVNWLAHANMDQLFRVLAGVPPIADGNEQTPLRLFDESNIDETGTPPKPDQGYGDAYEKGYEELWNGE